MFVAIVVLAALAAISWPKWRALLEPRITRHVEAGPAIVRDASGEAVLATLLVHDQSRWSRSRAGRGTKKLVELQLNRMADAADLGRVFVHGTSNTGNPDVHLLGTEPDRVWVFAEGLRAISVPGREVELDGAALETRAPELKDQLPTDGKFYEFDPQSGLRITARDGTRYLLDTRTFALGPQPEPTPAPTARDPQEWSARHDESTATTFAQLPGEYGLDSWRSADQWLGVLSDAEQRRYSRHWDRPRQHGSADPERRKIWTAPVTATTPRSSRLGEMRALRNDTYLRGGFLRDGRRLRPVQENDSPDLFVEHYSAVDDSGQMLLTRITPEGEERWTAMLPIKLPNTVCATDEYVAFRGLPPRTEFLHRAQLVCLRLSDGSFRSFPFD